VSLRLSLLLECLEVVVHLQVLRDLRLGHREVVDDRPDGLLACDQRVQDLAAARESREGVNECEGEQQTAKDPE
jgi:hypothetical protein